MNRPCHTCKKNTHHELIYTHYIGGKLVEREYMCEECNKKTLIDYRKVNDGIKAGNRNPKYPTPQDS